MRLFPTEANKARYREVCKNFATPLMGTYLNLTDEPAVIHCPNCGLNEETEVHIEMKAWANTVNRIFHAIFLSLCCCCCFDYCYVANKTDANHYCKNCSCYLGRAKRVRPLKCEKGQPITNLYE